VLDWADAAAAGPGAAGGKGWNLGRLHRYGLPVPEGAVLSAAAYRLFMQANGLLAEAMAVEQQAPEGNGPGSAGAEARLAALRERIREAPLPRPLERALRAMLALPGLAGELLAVRSSATVEDGSRASFAGMHHSSLNVPARLEAVAAAVKACYASLWTPHALDYRRRQQLGAPVEMAVVVMRLIPARAAGVAFSADPRTGRRDRIVITANFGLGESVVGGAADADELQLQLRLGDLPQVIHRRAGRKERLSVPDGGANGGTRLVGRADAAARSYLPEGSGNETWVLTDDEAVRLSILVLRCQDAAGEDGEPQDVEWAYDGERFWITQCRPITSLPDPGLPLLRGQRTIWSTANVKEVLPPVLTPHAWSSLRLSFPMLMEAAFERSGYQVQRGLRWMRLYHGHPLFNLSLMQAAFYEAFGVRPANFNRLLGGQQPEIRVPHRFPFLGRGGLGRLWRMLRQIWEARRAVAEVEEACQAFQALYRSYASKDVSRLDDGELFGEARLLAHKFAEFNPYFMRANGQASMWLDLIVSTLERLLPARGRGLAMRLLAGTGGMTSAEQGYRLVEIAQRAAGDPRARDFFLRARPPAATGTAGDDENDGGAAPEAAPRTTEWERYLAGTAAEYPFRQFLADYGHRAIDELDFSRPRWVEDPTYLIETIREHMLGGTAVPAGHAQHVRERAEAELRRALGLHPAYPVIRWMLGRARVAAALRENSKSVLVLSILPFRQLAGEMARRVVARGQLPAVNDFWFLTDADVMAAFQGLWDGRGARELIADRRARYLAQQTMRVPDVLVDDRPVHVGRPAADDGAGQVFQGIGVAAGQASGPARVIPHPQHGDRLRNGDILVAPTTDPGWTPLFLRAAGLVMETGGYLSHGAIVAREYGLPAVANVVGIVDAVSDGDTLLVDGDHGRVTRRPPGPPLHERKSRHQHGPSQGYAPAGTSVVPTAAGMSGEDGGA
jgi:pyruvate,water dikinase